jgi:hypothetical protein
MSKLGSSNILIINEDTASLKVTATGGTHFTGPVTVGIDDFGHDVKFYGNSVDSYFLWDTSTNRVHTVGKGQNSMRIETTLDTTAIGPAYQAFRNSPDPEINDTIGGLGFFGNTQDDGSASGDDLTEVQYVRLRAKILDETTDSAEGELQISTLANSVQTIGLEISGQADATVDIELGGGVTSATKVKGYFAANNQTPAVAPDYTITNLSTDRALDCDSTSDAEVADVLGQVITDLIAIGIFK